MYVYNIYSHISTFLFTPLFSVPTDEGALVDAAKQLGVVFERRTDKAVTISVVSISCDCAPVYINMYMFVCWGGV